MGTRSDPSPGSARLELADGVLLLHPEDAALDAMLAGWEKQQRGGRRLQQETVDRRKSVVRRFVEYTNEYPWRWTAAHMDEWTAELVMEQALAESTLRNYQVFHAPFVAEICRRRTNHPDRKCHEHGEARTRAEAEGAARAARRPADRSDTDEPPPAEGESPCRTRSPTTSARRGTGRPRT